MENFFQQVALELMAKLGQVRQQITNHKPTTGSVTEEILRSFLKTYLPKQVSVEQGFIRNKNGQTSKQCDIIIYDSALYAPFYRINDLVVVPEESVIAIIEVKTTMNAARFQDTLDYFKALKTVAFKHSYLFIFQAESVERIGRFFDAYKEKNGPYTYDHDTFQFLPDEITGIEDSYHLKKDYVDDGGDKIGYSTFYYADQEGTAINALQQFYLSVYGKVESCLSESHQVKITGNRQGILILSSKVILQFHCLICDNYYFVLPSERNFRNVTRVIIIISPTIDSATREVNYFFDYPLIIRL